MPRHSLTIEELLRIDPDHGNATYVLFNSIHFQKSINLGGVGVMGIFVSLLARHLVHMHQMLRGVSLNKEPSFLQSMQSVDRLLFIAASR